jgi:hypothetical protein
LAPDLSHLSPGERTAVAKLLEVGKIFQRIYEDQRHKQALSSYRDLQTVSKNYPNPAPIDMHLFTLYRLNQGPIATTLENKREPFLPVDPVVPGKNMYPWGVTRKSWSRLRARHCQPRRSFGPAIGGASSHVGKSSGRHGSVNEVSGP